MWSNHRVIVTSEVVEERESSTSLNPKLDPNAFRLSPITSYTAVDKKKMRIDKPGDDEKKEVVMMEKSVRVQEILFNVLDTLEEMTGTQSAVCIVRVPP